jgi:hypothetical protein
MVKNLLVLSFHYPINLPVDIYYWNKSRGFMVQRLNVEAYHPYPGLFSFVQVCSTFVQTLIFRPLYLKKNKFGRPQHQNNSRK